jgi:hypothetical protein
MKTIATLYILACIAIALRVMQPTVLMILAPIVAWALLFLAVLLTLAALVWVTLRWSTRSLVVTGIVATLCVLLAFLLASPRPLALHQVVHADVTYILHGDPSEGPYAPQPHTYTLTDGSSLAQLERMLNALPALSGPPPCEQGRPFGAFYAAASIWLRTRSGQLFGFYLNGFCGVVITDPGQHTDPSGPCEGVIWTGFTASPCTYLADAGNGVLNFLRAHITPPCVNLPPSSTTMACTETPLPTRFYG